MDGGDLSWAGGGGGESGWSHWVLYGERDGMLQ
jgi:hypothetical protein